MFEKPNRLGYTIVGGIWLLALLLGGGLVLAALVGAAGRQSIPTVPALPTLPAPAVPLPQPEIPASGGPANANPGAVATPPPPHAALPSAFTFFEATHTPLVPVSPTPTFFITPVPFFEGPLEIGRSAGGHPLQVYRFGNGPVKRMIIAGIHGGYEWNTVALADQLIAHLQTHPEIMPRNVSLYVLRAMNPDGYYRSKGIEGRANANNVDLNRNFPAYWSATWPRRGCWDYQAITAGPAPMSEPETVAVMAFLSEKRIEALISYHSAALGIFVGGLSPLPASERLAEAVAGVSTYPYPHIETGCISTGMLVDWAATKGIAGLDIELHNHEETDFAENLRILEVFLAWRRAP